MKLAAGSQQHSESSRSDCRQHKVQCIIRLARFIGAFIRIVDYAAVLVSIDQISRNRPFRIELPFMAMNAHYNSFNSKMEAKT
jgi:hypothetical protein